MTTTLEEGAIIELDSSERKSPFPWVVVLVLVVALSAQDLEDRRWLVVVPLLTLLWAVGSKCLPIVHLSILAALMCYAPYFRHFYFHRFYLPFKAVYIFPYLGIAFFITPLRRSLDWLRIGTLGIQVWGYVAGSILFAVLALLAWVHFVTPDLYRYTYLISDAASGKLSLYVAVLSISNAIMEEIVWRGVMMTALDAVFGAGWLALILQAIQFGIMHFVRGFPNGWSGLGLAAIFGLFMGILRRRANGLLACCIAHSVADATILCLVIHFERINGFG